MSEATTKLGRDDFFMQLDLVYKYRLCAAPHYYKDPDPADDNVVDEDGDTVPEPTPLHTPQERGPGAASSSRAAGRARAGP